MNDAVATVTHDFSKEMLRWKCILQAYVLSVLDVSEVFCKSRSGMLQVFRGMLQLFHMDVAKIDRGMLHML